MRVYWKNGRKKEGLYIREKGYTHDTMELEKCADFIFLRSISYHIMISVIIMGQGRIPRDWEEAEKRYTFATLLVRLLFYMRSEECAFINWIYCVSRNNIHPMWLEKNISFFRIKRSRWRRRLRRGRWRWWSSCERGSVFTWLRREKRRHKSKCS